MLLTEMEIIRLQRKLGEEVKRSLDKNQRQYVLRAQLKAIQEELGEDEDEEDEIRGYRQKIQKLKAPAEVRNKLLLELKRLSKMRLVSPDAATIRNYLDEVLEYPWNKRTKESKSLKKRKRF